MKPQLIDLMLVLQRSIESAARSGSLLSIIHRHKAAVRGSQLLGQDAAEVTAKLHGVRYFVHSSRFVLTPQKASMADERTDALSQP